MINNLQGDTLKVRSDNNKYEPKFKTRKKTFLNFGEDDQMEIQGFVYNKLKFNVVIIFYMVTFGLLRLIFHWYPHWKLLATHEQCDLKKAEKVLVIDAYKGKYKSYFVKKIHILKAPEGSFPFHLNDGTKKELPEIRIIKCKKLTYIWLAETEKFVKLAGLEKGITNSDLYKFSGQTLREQNLKRIVYGNNEIIVPVQTILTLLVLEALTPFYMFQLFSLIVWFAELYYYYTIAIIVMSVFGISTSIIQTRKNQQNLKGTVHSSDRITVLRSFNAFEEIATTELVPGDTIIIPPGCQMQCDAVLLSGSCVVNESMLTGESVPVTKTVLPNNSQAYDVKTDANHTLFCGTKIIQTRCCEGEQVRAVVIRTGYLTTKGELVRSIMYPPPADFKFDQDSYKFIGILALFAFLGFIYTIVSKISRNIQATEIIIKALDLITIAVPPALPAAMTVGKLYALGRLKENKIYCINSRVINVSGSIDCFCFDKTGTLTEDELDMLAVVPVEQSKVKAAVKVVASLGSESLFLRGMAACHSLTVLNDVICGDPLDVKMFNSTNWSLGYNHDSIPSVKPKFQSTTLEISIVHLFQFSSSLQRMSVITKSSDRPNYDVFCKGSPEMIMSLSDASTIPIDIKSNLHLYTEQGYRVIALGTKSINNRQQTREDVESDLTFLGLIVLENKLKPQTKSVVNTLKKADMKIVMITGDNIQTAVNVAKECHIIDAESAVIEVVINKPTKFDFAKVNYFINSMPDFVNNDNLLNDCKHADIEAARNKKYQFVVTGTSWSHILQYFPDLVPKIVTKGVVFARMSGSQKQQLIEELKNLGYYVAMCGDGANDCGALKAAHVGISLSDAESSVASPFTSKEANISCAPKVIKEGRAALVTSFGVFKLMICYSLTQFVSVLTLYNIDANLSSFQYLFIDIFLILSFASFFGRTKAYEMLDKTPPMTSLLNLVPIASIVCFMVVAIAFQVIAYFYVESQDWFTPFVYNPKKNNLFVCYENYAVFTISVFQYIIMAVVFSKAKPYRQRIYTNKLFLFTLVVMTLVGVYIAVYPAQWVVDVLELKEPPSVNPRLVIVGLGVLNFVVCVMVEDFFVEYALKQFIAPRSSQKYLKVLQEKENIWLNVSYNETVILDKVSEDYGVVNGGFEQDVVTTRC